MALMETRGRLQGLALGAAALIGALGATEAVAQEFTWSMQSNLATTAPGYQAVQENFVEAVEEMSGGRMKITLHPSGAIYPISESLDAVSTGVVEIGMAAGGYFAGTIGPIAVMETGLPGAERNATERFAFFYKKGFIDIVREAYAEQGVFYLAPNISPPWHLMSKTPITSAADFEGMKVRAFGIEAEWFQSMGASTVFLGGEELYTALSTGVIDAARWGDEATNYNKSLHEVAGYFVRPPSMPAPNNNILINLDAWNSLPPDIQKMMDMAARQASLDYLLRGTMLNGEAAVKLADAGVEFSEISPEEYAKMEANVREIWAGYAEEDPKYAAPAVALLQEFLAELGR